MAKADLVEAGVAAIQAGEVQVYTDQLGIVYEGAFKEGVASVPADGFTQADIDAAVAADKALLQPQIDSLTEQVSALKLDDDAKTKLIESIEALLAPPAPSPA